ncbi:MAG: ABC transporter permease, partial [Bryobacteraceae bacterium]
PAGLGPVKFDARVAAFALVASVLAAVVFALASRVSGPRLRPALVAGEVALSLVLVTGASLLAASFVKLRGVDPGFDPEDVVTMRVTLPERTYREPHRVATFYTSVLDRMRRLPGVEGASIVSTLPLTGGRGGDPFSIEGRPYDASGRTPQSARSQAAGEGYFRLMRIPLIAGRDFTASDAATAPRIAIVNQTLARGFWPAGDALGKRIVVGAPRPGAAWLTIVGIADDVHASSLDADPIPQIYTPHAQSTVRSMYLVARGGSAAAIARQVLAVDPEQPVYGVRTLRRHLDDSIAQPRLRAWMLGAFAALALGLAAVGIYGVVSHDVALRTREIGIRMALGAPDAAATIVRRGLRIAGAGVALGVAGSLALSRSLGSLLYRVDASDPRLLAASALALSMVALVALWVPARRAARVDPAVALRVE